MAALVGAVVLVKKKERGMIPAGYFFAVAVVLFVLGVVAFFVKQRPARPSSWPSRSCSTPPTWPSWPWPGPPAAADAQAVVFFVITVAAAEAAVGLAIILLVFRRRKIDPDRRPRTLKG